MVPDWLLGKTDRMGWGTSAARAPGGHGRLHLRVEVFVTALMPEVTAEIVPEVIDRAELRSVRRQLDESPVAAF